MQPQDIDNFAIPWPKVVDYDPMGRIGLRVSLYFRDGYAIERRQALLRIVEQYVAFAGDRIKLYQQAGERRYRTASASEPVDLEPTRSATTQPMASWGLFLSGEPNIGTASHWSLATVASGNGYLLLHFPVTAFEESQPHAFRKLFQQWCSELKVQQAYAGLGIILPTGGRAMHTAIDHCGPVASRFIGLDVDYPGATARSCKDGIRCINWLTAINESWLERVHGADAVLQLAGPDVTSMPYDGGTIFIAGPNPQFGDAENGLIPKEYVALGRAVAPLRVEYQEWLFLPPEHFTTPPDFTASYVKLRVEPEALPKHYFTHQWMARFDGV